MAVGRASPPIPPPAPASVIEISTSVLGTGVNLSNGAALQPHQPNGTPVDVTLADPGSGGAYEFISSSSGFDFKVGETLNLTLTAQTEFHTFTVDAAGLDVSVDKDQTVRFSVTFDRPGSYQLICVPHQGLGMVATINVK